MLCRCPKLTPLQTRLLASVSALALLALIYWSLSNPHFAYAAELAVDGSGQLRSGEDHNWHRIRDGPILDERNEAGADDYLGSAKRAVEEARLEGNNIGTQGEIAPGNATIWEYPSTLLAEEPTAIGAGLPWDNDEETVSRVRHHDLRKRSEKGEEALGLEARQTGRTIYISANTCRQPLWNGTGTQSGAPPQLTLYVSQRSGNRNLGPGGSGQTEYPFVGGFVNATVSSGSGDWYMAVAAPELPGNFMGSWSYQIAASIDDFFHATSDERDFLTPVDTDTDSALLWTRNLTEQNSTSDVYQKWMNLSPPFVLFAANSNLTGSLGVENSFCGLQTFISNNSQIQANQSDLQGNSTHVQMGMTTHGLGHKPKQQFYVTNLNRSSEYRVFAAIDGNSTQSGDGVVRGGGKVWSTPRTITTKSDGNCQLMFNLTFCSEVAYAVPSNPSFGSFEKLQAWYDNYTTTWYGPFNWTLGQIACETTSDAKYSLARNCEDCAAAYKEWLCAVSIPRCEDYSNPARYLQPRNVAQAFHTNNSMLSDEVLQTGYTPMPGAPTLPGSNAFMQTLESSYATNRSRNQWIDEDIKPGPYKEVLPCQDICWNLMKSCPSSMNLACPYPGRGLEASYGKMPGEWKDPTYNKDVITCSYLGAVSQLGAAAGLTAHVWLSLAISGLSAALLVFG